MIVGKGEMRKQEKDRFDKHPYTNMNVEFHLFNCLMQEMQLKL